MRIISTCIFLMLLEGCQGCYYHYHSDSVVPIIPLELAGGIPNVENCCYMNAVVQIITKLYPHLFTDHDSELAQAGQVIVDKIKEDQENATEEEANVFCNFIEKQFFNKKSRTQQDADEFFHRLVSFLKQDEAIFNHLVI